MYVIALCDDETADLRKTEHMLNLYEEKHPEADFMVECFKNADELLHMIKEKNYMPDLIFMDIYMPGKMGIEAAKELRQMGNEGRIIFLNTSKEHALEAFGVDAVQYLVKPIAEKQLFHTLDKFLKDVDGERRKYLLLRIEGRISRVALKDIIYCEAQGKIQCLHLTDGSQCLLRLTMTETYEMISKYQEFVRVGVAYIVNLDHVESLNARELQMDNGKKIYLPRGSYRPLRERYFDYYCEEEEE